MKPLEYKTQHHPTTRSSTLCRTRHLNNRQNKNTNPVISRQDYHLTQPCSSKEKQTKTQHKSHPIGSLYYPMDQPSVQFSRSVVSDSASPWIAARWASLSITNSQSSPKLLSIKSVMPTLAGQKLKGRKNSTFFKERIQLSLKPWKRDLKQSNLKRK